MTDQQLLERIAVEPRVMCGKPVMRGTRLTVEHIIKLLGGGAAAEDILEEYDGLTLDDVRACVLFASVSG